MSTPEIAEGLRNHMLKHEFAVMALMPWDSTVYGCAVCVVYWVDTPTCWCCDREGVMLAEPASKEDLFRHQYRQTT